jgi:predicted peroxiredoxin
MSKIFMKSSWGSDDPTRAAMVFGHSAALAKAGHEIRIFLLGEASVLARKAIRDQLFPVGWPALAEQWQSCVDLGVAIEVCDACRIARGITDQDLLDFRATVGSPATLVAGIEWADKVIAE